jgi:hypothetical protein
LALFGIVRTLEQVRCLRGERNQAGERDLEALVGVVATLQQPSDFLLPFGQLTVLPVIDVPGNTLVEQQVGQTVQALRQLLALFGQRADAVLMIGLLGLVAPAQMIQHLGKERLRDADGPQHLPDLLQDVVFLDPHLLGRVGGIADD